MLSLYVFAAIVGIGLLALGALGSDADADVDIDVDAQVGDGELDVIDIEDLGAGKDAAWRKAFSLRSLAYFMAGFGATGVLLTLLEAAPATLTLLLSVGMGAAAALMVALLFGWLRSTEGGFGGSSDAYVGAAGRIRVPIRPGVPGSVEVEHEGRIVTMRARALRGAESDPARWTDVLVVDVDPEDGILLVQPLDELLLDDADPALGRLHP